MTWRQQSLGIGLIVFFALCFIYPQLWAVYVMVLVPLVVIFALVRVLLKELKSLEEVMPEQKSRVRRRILERWFLVEVVPNLIAAALFLAIPYLVYFKII